jgi:hypothetical protein
VQITCKYITTFIIGIQTPVEKCHLLFQVFVPVSSVVFYVLMDDIVAVGVVEVVVTVAIIVVLHRIIVRNFMLSLYVFEILTLRNNFMICRAAITYVM